METNNQKNDQNIIPNDADKQQKGVNVPNLRFNKYNDLWTKTTLNTVVERITRRNTNNESNLPLTISAQYGLINQNEFFNKQIASRDLTNYILLNRGEFAYNKSYSSDYPWGAVKRLDKYDKGVLSSLYICFAPKLNVDSDFLVHYFETPKWYNEISNISGEGARNHGLLNMAVSDYFNTKHSFPSIQEQHKISQFLNLINQRIDTQSKIIEDLQTLKISICDKVFEDTTYPEYKLKDVLSERIEKSNVNNQYEILSSTIKGLFTQKEYFDKDIASSNNIGYKIVHLYDIIISPQNLWMGNITFNQRFTNGLVSPSYKIYIINNNFDMYYIANMLKTKKAMYKYICSSQQGASVVRRNLNMDDFLSLSFCIPDINKQRKIGLLLNTIDKRIDLEQTYLTKLNQQKKFLLKNMFI